MAVTFTGYNSLGLDARHRGLEDYDACVRELAQSGDHHNGSLNQTVHGRQNPTPTSEHSRHYKSASPTGNRLVHTSTEARFQDKPYSKSGPTRTMDSQYGFHSQAPNAGFTPDSQQDDDAVAAPFMTQQSAALFADPLSLQQGLSHQSVPDWLHQNASQFNWEASWQEMSSYHDGNNQDLNSPLQNDTQAQFGDLSFDAPTMSMLNSPVNNDPAAEAAAMQDFTNNLQMSSSSHDDDPFGRNDQALIMHQPRGIPVSNIGRLAQGAHFSNPAEHLLQSPPAANAPDADVNDPDTSPDAAHQSDVQATPEESQSPSSVAESSDQLRELAYNQQDSRRPSMTTEVTQNISDIHLQGSQSVDNLRSQTFRKPSMQRTSLAERRRQQGPNGINVSRPNGFAISRAVSSSAINQLPNTARYPTSPHGTLRRNKSSNVIGVMSGRVQKSGPNSSRASPMVASFGEAVSMQASQAVSQPLPMQAVQANQSLVPPSPHHQIAESQIDMLPASASTAMFTPGIHSGSMPGHSFQNTPVTTPYGFAQHQPHHAGQPWQAPADVPQSAPAHLVSFAQLSPSHHRPSMPPTPANYHFPQQMSHQIPNFQQHVMPNAIPMVPSQHGVPENMTFMPQANLEMFHPGLPEYPHHLGVHRHYADYDNWAMGHLPQAYQKPMEVKLDAGCDRLQQEIAEKRATMVHMENRGEYSFQNLSAADMKKQFESRE